MMHAYAYAVPAYAEGNALCCAVALWLYLRDTSCLYAVQGKPLCFSVRSLMRAEEGACLPIFVCAVRDRGEGGGGGEHIESTG